MSDDHHDITPPDGLSLAERLRFAELRVRAERAGYTLNRNGRFVLARRGHLRHANDLDAIEALLNQLDGGGG